MQRQSCMTSEQSSVNWLCVCVLVWTHTLIRGNVTPDEIQLKKVHGVLQFDVKSDIRQPRLIKYFLLNTSWCNEIKKMMHYHVAEHLKVKHDMIFQFIQSQTAARL